MVDLDPVRPAALTDGAGYPGRFLFHFFRHWRRYRRRLGRLRRSGPGVVSICSVFGSLTRQSLAVSWETAQTHRGSSRTKRRQPDRRNRRGEGKKQQQINEAEGEAAAILAIAEATANGIRKVAEATQQPGGFEAVQLRVAENYLTEFGKLAQAGNTLILPATLSDVGSMISLAMNVIKQQGNGTPGANKT